MPGQTEMEALSTMFKHTGRKLYKAIQPVQSIEQQAEIIEIIYKEPKKQITMETQTEIEKLRAELEASRKQIAALQTGINKEAEKINKVSEKLDIIIVEYSSKAIALFGATRQISAQLKEVGCKFNPYLTNPQTGMKQAGWIISKSKQQAVQNLIN